MKVICTSIPDNDDILSLGSWLKIGREYVVLSIYENAQKKRYYRIAPHDDGGFGSLGLFPSSAFEVTDGTWSQTWVEEAANDDISIAPKAWQRRGFWEDFYDGDRRAEDVYRAERDKILKHES